jgi:hypothetical protein
MVQRNYRVPLPLNESWHDVRLDLSLSTALVIEIFREFLSEARIAPVMLTPDCEYLPEAKRVFFEAIPL